MPRPGRVQFGIFGAGRIARGAFVPALLSSPHAELAAVASRDQTRADALHPKRAYARYDDLLNDPDVEAVYIATHNGLHHTLALAALEHGKHVLCEKPLAPTAAECRELLHAARQHDRHLVEAFMYRYHPQIAAADSVLKSGTLGDITTIEASFSFLLADESDVRWNSAWGGGALYDVGCYCVNACRHFMDAMPVAVTAFATFHPVHNVDVCLHGLLDFGARRYGVVSCGFDGGVRNRVAVSGTRGVLTLLQAFSNSNKPTTMLVVATSDTQETSFEPIDIYRLEIDDFARALRGDPAPLLAADEGLRNACVIEALLSSARMDGARLPVEFSA